MKVVLLVEDNADDIFFIQRACKSIAVPHILKVVTDGRLALDYLSGMGVYHDRKLFPFPDLVILDLKLPKHTGHQVLEWVRGQTQFKYLPPVVILSASTVLTDLKLAYGFGATSYFTKLATHAELAALLQTMFEYWLHVNITPTSQYL